MFASLFGKKKYKDISQSEAKKRLSTDKNIILLDVRTPEEYRSVHIPSSKLLPLDQVASKAPKLIRSKDAEIFVYCLSGVRAASACKQLAAMGYTNVNNMGGIQTWKYETERGN